MVLEIKDENVYNEEFETSNLSQGSNETIERNDIQPVEISHLGAEHDEDHNEQSYPVNEDVESSMLESMQEIVDQSFQAEKAPSFNSQLKPGPRYQQPTHVLPKGLMQGWTDII